MVVDGRSLFAAYTAKYAPKFSDAFQEELLNDDADANSIAVDGLAHVRDLVPPVSYHHGQPRQTRLLGASTRCANAAKGGSRLHELGVEKRGHEPSGLPPQIQRTGRDLRLASTKVASRGKPGVAGNFRQQLPGRRRKDRSLSDAYYGQWLLLNVPFRRVEDLLLPDEVLAKVPETDKYLAMCLTCPHPAAKAMFDNSAAWDMDMLFEGHALAFRRTVLDNIATQSHMVRRYLAGSLEPPSRASQDSESQPRRVHRFPIQKQHEEAIQRGRKTVEGRLYANVAVNVKQGDRIQLGRAVVQVQDLAVYESFADMLQEVGYVNAVPDAVNFEDAVETYLALPRYRELEKQCGVVAFWLADPGPREEPLFNHEQQRWLTIMEEDMGRAAAVHDAATEGDMDAARERAYYGKKIRVLEGPPGTGKTTTAAAAVQRALDKGLRVLWATYTAQLASRARQHLGLDLDFSECALNLAPYGLVVVDEFSQLRASDFQHIDQLYKAVDHACAFGLLGDRFQAAGFGEERVWHSQAWQRVHRTELHHLYRCKDPDFGRLLGVLRTSKPTATGPRGSLTVANIMKHRRAWRGHIPNAADVARLLRRYPHTTFMAITKRGAQQLNELATEALFGDKTPAATIPGDVESNPENYSPDGKLKTFELLKPLELACYPGMQVAGLASFVKCGLRSSLPATWTRRETTSTACRASWKATAVALGLYSWSPRQDIE